jgi:succinylglutamate desuccinylase
MGVEAGQHDRESSVDHHEAVLWLALIAAGMLEPEAVPERSRYRALLLDATRGIPRITEVRHRHSVDPEDEFRMEPGFVNFQPVQKGRLLARDLTGEIHARETGRLLLPLYQGQGDDGFFLGREVRPFWLKVSWLLRRLRFDHVVSLLPGVRRHPEQARTLVVDTRIARWYPLEVFHLLGYRKRRQVGDVLIVSRRVFDFDPPPTG